MWRRTVNQFAGTKFGYFDEPGMHQFVWNSQQIAYQATNGVPSVPKKE